MEKELNFLKTQSLADFKAEQGITEIKVFRNEDTSKCFFSYAGKTGAVTQKYPETALDKPVVSEVSSPVTGEVFMLLHNEQSAKQMLVL